MRVKLRTALLCTVAAMVASGPTLAQDASEQDQSAHRVEHITVTATRLARPIDEVPATVSVITSEEIENNLATDIKDLVRFEPGISVRTNPVRFSAALSGGGRDGNSGFNIRGLEGNRVLIQIDGIRVPDAFTFGPQVVGRGDYLDLDIVKSVEILRGPASALYGSDGLAGAVSFVTKDPDDFLLDDELFGGRVRAAYSSVDESFTEGAVLATQTESSEWQAMLAYTRRDAHETDNQGENESLNGTRTAPNPSDIESDNVFAKLVYAPDDENRLRLSYEYYDRYMETEAFSARTSFTPPTNSVLDLDGEDETTRNRVSLDHRYEGEGVISRAFWAVYYQEAETREFTYEDRSLGVDRTREGLFDNAVWGALAELHSEFQLGEIDNNLVYGFDYSVTRQEGLRNGTVPTPPDFFPQKPFPDTEFTFFGAYIQDEISIDDGRFVLYPAIRYDSFEVDPEPSPIYPIPTIAGQKDSHVTPKLSAIFWPVERLGVYLNYAEGFKAPAPSQVNNGFRNTAQDYSSIPNPNLRPETSETVEGGVRVRDIEMFGGSFAASASAFQADYKDFIEQVCVNANPAECAINGVPPTTIFQYINLGQVSIKGFETRADLVWDSGFTLTAALSTAEGTQTSNGVDSPLNTIDPLKLVAGLRFDDPESIFGAQAIVTYAEQKEQRDIVVGTCADSFGVPIDCYTPDAFTILDMTAYWNVTEQATLRVGLFNVFDENYAWWSDVRGVAATSPILDAYTQPGRNASVSLAYRF